jgi:hypothetical protein
MSFEISDIGQLKEEICAIRNEEQLALIRRQEAEQEKLKRYRRVAFSRLQTISRRVSTPLDSSIDAADHTKYDYSADDIERATARKDSISLRNQMCLFLDWYTDISERISTTISNEDEQKKLLSEINDKERELC